MKKYILTILAVVSVLISVLHTIHQTEVNSHTCISVENFSSGLPPNKFIEDLSYVLQSNGYTVLSTPDNHHNVCSVSNNTTVVHFSGKHFSGNIMVDGHMWQLYHDYSIKYSIDAKGDVNDVIDFLDGLFSSYAPAQP